MATRRKKTTAKKTPTKKAAQEKPTRGRPPIGGRRMTAGIFVRCSEEQRAAIEAHVEELNQKREAKGLPRVEISTWVREVALKYSGNSELGAAAEAKRLAAASIV